MGNFKLEVGGWEVFSNHSRKTSLHYRNSYRGSWAHGVAVWLQFLCVSH